MTDVALKNSSESADLLGRGKGKSAYPLLSGSAAGQNPLGGESLIALAKALKLTADLLVLEEGQNSGQHEIRELIREIVRAELKTLLSEERSISLPESEVLKFLSSDKIPEQHKKLILRQIKNLLERYEGGK